MKTYHNQNDAKQRNFFMRHIKAFVIAFSAVLVAAAVTLAVVFSLPKTVPTVKPDDPTDDKPKATVVMPVDGATTGQEFANDKLVYWSTLKQWLVHEAVDFIAPAGTDVVAVKDGTVLSVKETTLEGTVVTIEHADGYKSVYKSIDNVAVTEGAAVKAGDKIGKIANTMMTEELTGAHLHFEVMKGTEYVDPAELLPASEDK